MVELVLVGTRPLATAAPWTFESGPDSLLIDASRLEFACPLDLAGVVATARWASDASMPVTLKLPVNTALAAYLQRMDVLRLMPSRTRVVGRVPKDTRTDREDRLLEVTPLTPDNADDVGQKVGRLVRAFYADRSRAAGHVVYRACGELLANAVEHGLSHMGAFIAVQAYSGESTDGPRLEVAVCDTGIGVLQHLRQNRAFSHLWKDEDALARAIEPGVSGLGAGRGNGLSDLIKDTSRYGSVRFEMRSGRGEIRVVAAADTSHPELRCRPDQTRGTWAWLTHALLPDGSDCGSMGKMKREKQ